MAINALYVYMNLPSYNFSPNLADNSQINLRLPNYELIGFLIGFLDQKIQILENDFKSKSKSKN